MDEEQDQILFALQNLSTTGQVDVEQILTKLRAIFDKAGSNWIAVDFSRWGNSKPDNKRFEVLKNGILKILKYPFRY
ncbi:MAG: hypothetical protein LBJ36_00750 [Synergistaceae bacterium]|nr:hypothetical protein [Synergistaceae bacterium]